MIACMIDCTARVVVCGALIPRTWYLPGGHPLTAKAKLRRSCSSTAAVRQHIIYSSTQLCLRGKGRSRHTGISSTALLYITAVDNIYIIYIYMSTVVSLGYSLYQILLSVVYCCIASGASLSKRHVVTYSAAAAAVVCIIRIRYLRMYTHNIYM